MNLIEQALQSKAWPFVEAKKILEKINHTLPSKGYVLFCTGYGPSGLPHIGTFCEVARTSMVRRAFEIISQGMPTRLICFSDDMDGLRKVPSNIPNREMVAQYMNVPLTSIPDPFGVEKSYGDYMNAKLRSFLDAFNFEYEFYSATDCYKRGMFDAGLMKVSEKYQQIMDLLLPTLREQRQATYSPFMPLCPRTNQVLQVPILSVHGDTITYQDPETQDVMETKITVGKCKLQWRVDFGMRWAELQVDYEMYGKDHLPNGPLYTSVCKILGGTPPTQFFYELFLDETGEKISKSKGNSITIDEWLSYAPIESLGLFVYQNPSRAKKLSFDVIPKSVDEYLAFNAKYHQEPLDKQLVNPAYHLHEAGNVPQSSAYGISFSLLLNLASVCNPENPEVLWGFVRKYNPAASKDNAYFDRLINCAISYYNTFVRDKKVYHAPTETQRVILQEILDKLSKIPQDTPELGSAIQNELYSIGKAHYEDLRQYFSDLYKILLEQEEGPRLGSFMALYGIDKTQELIKSKL